MKAKIEFGEKQANPWLLAIMVAGHEQKRETLLKPA